MRYASNSVQVAIDREVRAIRLLGQLRAAQRVFEQAKTDSAKDAALSRVSQAARQLAIWAPWLAKEDGLTKKRLAKERGTIGYGADDPPSSLSR